MIKQLQDYPTRSAERDPATGALVMGDEPMSYGELEADTNQWARLMQACGGRDGEQVCDLASKTPRTIASLLAILKELNPLPRNVNGKIDRNELESSFTQDMAAPRRPVIGS